MASHRRTKAGDEVRLWPATAETGRPSSSRSPAALMALRHQDRPGRRGGRAAEGAITPAPLWVRYSVLLRLRSPPRRRRGSARPRARRAPGPAPQAPQARRRRDHLQRSPDRRRRGGNVPPRLPHGARRNRLELRRQPLQERPVPRWGEGQEPGLRLGLRLGCPGGGDGRCDSLVLCWDLVGRVSCAGRIG